MLFSVSAQKLSCPSLAWLATFPTRLGSAWKTSVWTHEWLKSTQDLKLEYLAVSSFFYNLGQLLILMLEVNIGKLLFLLLWFWFPFYRTQIFTTMSLVTLIHLKLSLINWKIVYLLMQVLGFLSFKNTISFYLIFSCPSF